MRWDARMGFLPAICLAVLTQEHMQCQPQMERCRESMTRQQD